MFKRSVYRELSRATFLQQAVCIEQSANYVSVENFMKDIGCEELREERGI
jgi:hypothetical protein